MIVIEFPTVTDGPVYRWYRHLTAAEIGDEDMSASRNGVRVNVFLHEIPEEAMNAADDAYAALAAGRRPEGVVTHRLVGFGSRRRVVALEPAGG